jgi:hypothetical protein
VQNIPLNQIERVEWQGQFARPIGLPVPRLGISLPVPILALKNSQRHYFYFLTPWGFRDFIQLSVNLGVRVDQRLVGIAEEL